MAVRVGAMFAVAIVWGRPGLPSGDGAGSTPVVLWMAATAQCFDRAKGYRGIEENVQPWMPGGDTSEPVRVGTSLPRNEEIESTGETPAVMIFEIVIDRQGRVEAVVSLKPRFPKTEALVARHLRRWRFKPAVGPSGPVCIRYVITYRMCY